MTGLGAEYIALMQNRLAILAVRARQKRENRVLRIPLYCEGHRTGVAIELMVMNEDGEGQTVPDYLLIYTVPDAKADKPGTAENGHSYAGTKPQVSPTPSTAGRVAGQSAARM